MLLSKMYVDGVLRFTWFDNNVPKVAKGLQGKQGVEVKKTLVDEELPQASRSADPESSHAAEEEITLSSARGIQLNKVLEALKANPSVTAMELGNIINPDDLHRSHTMCARRLPELVPINLATVSKVKRKCSITRRLSQVWTAVGHEPQQDLF